jgi:hypothetical protein
VNVETALTVERLVWPGETEIEVKDALNVGIENIIALTGEYVVAHVARDRLPGVAIEGIFARHPFFGRILAIISWL